MTLIIFLGSWRRRIWKVNTSDQLYKLYLYIYVVPFSNYPGYSMCKKKLSFTKKSCTVSNRSKFRPEMSINCTNLCSISRRMKTFKETHSFLSSLLKLLHSLPSCQLTWLDLTFLTECGKAKRGVWRSVRVL